MGIPMGVTQVRPGGYQQEMTRRCWKCRCFGPCTSIVLDKIARECKCEVSSRRVAGDDDVRWIISHNVHEMDISRERIEERSREGMLFRERVCRRETVFHREKVWCVGGQLEEVVVYGWHERGTRVGRVDDKRAPVQVQEYLLTRIGDR